MSEADPLALVDPLGALPAPERVNYATGALLDAEDFRDEQTYHRNRLAAALRGLTGFGTISGLRVRAPVADDAELELSVDAGIALDRIGRLVEIAAPQCIRIARWFAAQPTPVLLAAMQPGPPLAIIADIFLSARDCARGKTPAFATGPFDALDAVIPSRLAETPFLELVPRDEAAPIPAPANFWPGVAASDDEKLRAVLGSHERLNGAVGETFDPLTEHVPGHDPLAVLLARVSIAVTLPPGAPSDARPLLDLLTPVSVDNSLRPFIFLPGKWLGQAFVNLPLVQP
jgi:hypothetical protein